MKKYLTTLKASYLIVFASLFFFTSCNKDVEQFAPIATPVYPTGNGIAATLATNTNYSFYNAMIARGGMTATLNDLTKTFTLFATDNAGMKLFVNSASSGAVPLNAPDATFLGFINGSLPVATAAAIVQYNTVGQKYAASSFGSAFPNYPITSQIILDPTQPFVRMPIFPTNTTPTAYVNTMPIIAPEFTAANGVIHTTYTVVSPLPASPTVTTLRTLINADANLTYFKAAIARADSGQVGISGVGPYGLQFDSLMNYPITNMTVLAPNNQACKNLLDTAVRKTLIAQGVNPVIAAATATAVASSPSGFNQLPVDLVRGLIAYHIFASNNTGSYKPDIRAFSVNFSPNPNGFAKTLVNGSVAAHPGVMAQATFTGPFVSALKFTGLGGTTASATPYAGPSANATAWDRMALNGVLHVIDRALLPQNLPFPF